MIKITKEKEVVKEQVVVEERDYFFEDESLITYTVTIRKEEDGYVSFYIEKLQDFANVYGITIYEDEVLPDNLPYAFKEFIFSGKKEITKENFEKERRSVINRL